MKLLFIESHQDRRYKEVENYECHEDNAGSNQESSQNWIVIQNLWVEENYTMNKSKFLNISSEYQFSIGLIFTSS